MLALAVKARLWEPRRLWFHLFTAAAQLITTGGRGILRLARHRPWTSEITTTHTIPPGTAEPGAHPTRQSGYQPAHRLAQNTERSADSVGGPSRKIEARTRHTSHRS